MRCDARNSGRRVLQPRVGVNGTWRCRQHTTRRRHPAMPPVRPRLRGAWRGPNCSAVRETLRQPQQAQPDAGITYLRIGARETHGAVGLEKIEFDGNGARAGLASARLVVAVEKHNGHLEGLGDAGEPTCGYAVCAPFIFLDLLKADAQDVAEVGLAPAALQPQRPQALCDVCISRIVTALCHLSLRDAQANVSSLPSRAAGAVAA